jgi:hypothetical protein
MINLELLIGPFEEGEADWLVRERLDEEPAPQMLRAAAEAMVDCRARARQIRELDVWSLNRFRWVADWIKSQGFVEPSAEDVRAARMEYSAVAQAA